MVGLSIVNPIVRAKLVRISDGLIVAVAVSLPWSTSATGILLVLWLLALFPTLEWSDVRRELMTPAGGLPVLLVLLGVLGMTWADVPLLERWKGLAGSFKLLVIPLLMVQFRRSDNGTRVFIGFLIACLALLVASWIVTIWPGHTERLARSWRCGQSLHRTKRRVYDVRGWAALHGWRGRVRWPLGKDDGPARSGLGVSP